MPGQYLSGEHGENLIGADLVLAQRIKLGPKRLSPCRQLGEGVQCIRLAVKVGQQALARSSLFVAIGLDKGSRRPSRSDRCHVVSLPS